MLDVHVPHKTEHTWTDFTIHIATITIGLFIAIGLEQTVEYFHHLHQCHQLEEELRDELRADLSRDAEDFRIFKQIRAYTVVPPRKIDLFNAIVFQYSLTSGAIDDFQHAAFALESFEERFADSPGAFDMGYPAPPPPLDMMSPADLAQYEALLATYIQAVDRPTVRLHFFDRVIRGVLDGATDREDLIQRAFPCHKPPSLDLPEPTERSPQP
jgi:hypothetical protein